MKLGQHGDDNQTKVIIIIQIKRCCQNNKDIAEGNKKV